MNKVNSIVVCRDTYDSDEEFQNAIKDAIIVLLNNNYIMTVRYDEHGIVAIDYETEHREYGAPYPYWLTEDEYYSVVRDDERTEQND